MRVYHENDGVKAQAVYCPQKVEGDPESRGTLKALLAQREKHVELMLFEKPVNMPVEVLPPIYEITWVASGNEPYKSTHLPFISRTYHLSQDEIAMQPPPWQLM